MDLSASSCWAPNLKLDLSDSAKYAFASLTALILHQHYADEKDVGFKQDFMKRLLQYIQLEASWPVMEMLMESGDHKTEPYIDLLMDDPCLCHDGSVLIFETLILGVTNGMYDARTRVIIQEIASLLKIGPEKFDMLECSIAEMIINDPTLTLSEEEECKRRKLRRKQTIKKYALIGAAGVTGGVLLGLTGGIAAPLIGAGVTTLLGGTVVASASAAGIAAVGSVFGIAGAGLTGYKMRRRVGDVQEFRFIPLAAGEGSLLHVTIAIPGWLPPPEDSNVEDTDETLCQRYLAPWETLAHSHEQYGLVYETRYMLQLGSAMDMVYNMVASTIAKQALKMTALQGLMAAVALPQTVMNLTSIIDNPWGVCCRRCVKVGQLLAETLMDRKLGQRPVTLVGFSLGARIIFYCLREMQQRGADKSIVQDAILIGAPVTGKAAKWQPLLDVIAGRLVNVFSRNDWLLKILYRTTSVAVEIAGLQPIDIDHRRLVNIDLSAVITGHADYRNKANDCIKAALLRTNDFLNQ